MNNHVVGLDIAKSIFHFYSLSAEGKPIKKKLKRSELLAYIANMPVSLIGMEWKLAVVHTIGHVNSRNWAMKLSC